MWACVHTAFIWTTARPCCMQGCRLSSSVHPSIYPFVYPSCTIFLNRVLVKFSLSLLLSRRPSGLRNFCSVSRSLFTYSLTCPQSSIVGNVYMRPLIACCVYACLPLSMKEVW